MAAAEPRLLLLETSGRIGQIALAESERLLGIRRLDEARRHARDLAPAVRDLLAEQHWQPRDLHAVVVSRGPGSYTGLRVGIMSAKAFAYTTGCVLLAVDTLAAIASQSAAELLRVDVLADAQQGKVYMQSFIRATAADSVQALGPLHIRDFADWIAGWEEGAWVSGPGLRGHEDSLTGHNRVVAADLWEPRPESLLRLGLARYRNGERDDLWALEPLYLRPSSAEQQWQARKA
jgi:tRNA threonylcarbamoyladenosine biosynthesis protein TsaB